MMAKRKDKYIHSFLYTDEEGNIVVKDISEKDSEARKNRKRSLKKIETAFENIETSFDAIKEILHDGPLTTTVDEFVLTSAKTFEFLDKRVKDLNEINLSMKKDFLREMPFKYEKIEEDMIAVKNDPNNFTQRIGQIEGIYHTEKTIKEMSEKKVNNEVEKIIREYTNKFKDDSD